MNYPDANSLYWDLDVARDQGFFADEGFSVSHRVGGSTPQVIQALIAGDERLVTPQPDALMVAIARGAKALAVLAQPALEPDWILIGRKGVKGIVDLKGSTLGLSALGGSEQMLLNQVLARAGVPTTAFSVVVVGLTPAKFAALEKGSVAAAVLYQPTAELALSLGLPALYRFSALSPAYPPAYYVVNRNWAAGRDRGQRLARIMARAQAWLWDPSNRGAAIAILEKHTARKPDLLAKVYDQYFVTDKIYSPDAKVRLTGVQTVINGVVAQGQLAKSVLSPAEVILPAASGGLVE